MRRVEAATQRRKPTKQRKAKRGPSEAKKEEWKNRSRDLFDALVQGVNDTDLDTWKSMLVRQTDFIEYSFLNTCLIVAHWEELKRSGVVDGDITVVAPRTRWAKRNRTIRDDMRRNGLPIFVPMVRRIKSENDDEDETERRVRFFRIRWVYDVTQTEGEGTWERQHPRHVGGDRGIAVEYAERLIAYLRDRKGITVEVRPLALTDPVDMAVQGFWSPDRRLIVVGTRTREGVALDEPMRLRILLHEAAHALLGHTAQTTLPAKGLQEVEAESSAYVVGTAIGLEAGDYSFGYVKGWLQTLPPDKRGRELLDTGGKVARVARELLVSGLEAYDDTEGEE
jgi:hypothetical protein